MNDHSRIFQGALPRRQRGFVLVVALIFMIVLTLLGTGVVTSTTAEEGMARNFTDYNVAFSAAEAAMRDAELLVTGAYKWPYDIKLTANNFSTNCQGSYTGIAGSTTGNLGLCDSRQTPAVSGGADQVDFFGSTTPGPYSIPIGTITGTPNLPVVSQQPRYLIEIVTTNKLSGDNTAFRITAQGMGRFPNTVVTLQEIYAPTDSL